MIAVIINGHGTAGKDVFIDKFTEVAEEVYGDALPVFRFSSVDEVKKYAMLLGWDGVKDEKGRRLLSDIKDALTRYNDAPFSYMKQKYDEVGGLSTNAVIFFHVREPEEIEKAVKEFDAVTILIERECATTFTNHADTGVHDYAYDYYVSNYGTISDLKTSARVIFGELFPTATARG